MSKQLELPLFEEWKTIENYENYQVSNFGRIKSLERIDNNNHLVKERILKQSTNKYGYQRIQLCKDGKPKIFSVHRLVAMAFIPNPNNYEQVNHKDECKTNNHVDNLEWCTAKFNSNYGTRNEKVSKQIIQLTLGGDYIKLWNSIADVQRELGYNNAHICSCCKGKRKTSNCYKWCYA